MRISVRYDRAFATPNTWILNALADGIRARVVCASSDEYVIDVAVWSRIRREGAIHARQLDGSTWLLEGAVHHQDMARVELALVQVPEVISAALDRL